MASTITIGSNLASLNAQRHLARSSQLVQSSFTRLSSGLRITKAADDAAGLAIASLVGADARVYSQALRNVNDGIAALDIAQAALGELTSITIRQKELAQQAANGIYSLAQRQAMNDEANALVDEFNRIINSTEFNGQELINGSISELKIQAGYGTQNSLDFNPAEQLLRTVGDGTFTPFSAYDSVAGPINIELGELTGGKLDAVVSGTGGTRLYIGNGDGTFTDGGALPGAGESRDIVIADYNGDGKTDIAVAKPITRTIDIFIGNGSGNFSQSGSFTVNGPAYKMCGGDINGDGIQDLISADMSSNTASVLIGKGNGMFETMTTYQGFGSVQDVATADMNGDGILDLLTAEVATGAILSQRLGNGDGTFGNAVSVPVGGTGSIMMGYLSVVAADVNRDGAMDAVVGNSEGVKVLIGNGDGTYQSAKLYSTNSAHTLSVADLNGDGNLDIVRAGRNTARSISVLLGNGDGTFRTKQNYSGGDYPYWLAIGDINNDGAQDVVTAQINTGDYGVFLGRTRETATAPYLNINTSAGARAAMETLNATLERISQGLSAVGSMQSRLTSIASTLSISRENYCAAASRIKDADIAEESAQLVKNQMLQQAGAAILSQANQAPQLALTLLRA